MPKRAKHKLKRLESKFKEFNSRTLVVFLVVALILFVAGVTFSDEPGSLNELSSGSLLLKLAFLWVGAISILLSIQFGMGMLNARAEKEVGLLIWQASWFSFFFGFGVWVAFFGISGQII
jgi:hypothetical protein